MTERFLSPFGDNPAARVARRLLRRIPPRTVLPILSGPMRGQRWIVGAGVHSCWLGVYERPKQAELVRLLRPGDVFVDVGAHAGLYTLLASRLVGPRGRIYALEPLPSNVRMLRRHLELNRVTNVNLIEAAAGAESGAGRFASGSTTYTGHLGQGELTVQVVQIDDLYQRDLVGRPTVIKIDVEGAEVEVLAGARATLERDRPTVVLATHGDAAHESSTALLRELGYTIRSLGRPDELVADPAGKPRSER